MIIANITLQQPGTPLLETSPGCRSAGRLLSVFGPAGGVATGNHVAQLVQAGYSQPVSRVARWIVDRELLTFPWQGDIMVPLFQFVDAPLRPMHVIAQLLAELDAVMDDWTIAHWLATGNEWLDGRTPVAALRSCDERAVLWSARAERVARIGS